MSQLAAAYPGSVAVQSARRAWRNGTVLDAQTEAGESDLEWIQRRLVQTDLKYPLLVVEERIVIDPAEGDASIAQSVAMVADHIVVKLRPNATERDLRDINDRHGARIRRRMRAPDMYLVEPARADLHALREALAAYNEEIAVVAYAEPDYVVTTQETIPNDPMFSQLYGLRNTGQTGGTPGADISAARVWTIEQGSRDILIGVIDTGIDYNHPDLMENIWVNPGEIGLDGEGHDKRFNGVDDDGNGFIDDWRGWDFYNNNNDPFDDNRHGTHCAGTIGAAGNNGVGVVGVKWNTSLVGIKFLSAGGSGFTSDAIESVYYATAIGCDLTSNSWGGGGYSQGLVDAIGHANNHGVLFVAAAGNNGANADVSPMYPAAYTNENIISVAATDHNDNRAGFSNYGANSVDLGAPGVSIVSTTPNNGYQSLCGTSMACPHVAGVAGLIWGRNPLRSHMDVKAAILAGVDPVPSLTGITVTGGRLNVYNAILELGMMVIGSVPGTGDVVTSPPVEFVVQFSDPYDPDSVEASDLQVNDIPADQVTLSDAETLVFEFFETPVTHQGAQTMRMDSNAVLRLSDGTGLSPWLSEFRYDALRMSVVATDPPNGSVVTIPFTNIRVHLNEPYDPASVSIHDLNINQGTVADFILVDEQTLDYALEGIWNEGEWRLDIHPGAWQDEFGNPSLGYSGTHELDILLAPFPLPLRTVLPLGGLIYETSVTAGIHDDSDEDLFYIAIEEGQTVSVLAEPHDDLLPTIELYGPDHGVLATDTAALGGRGAAIIQPQPTTLAGIYTVKIRGSDGSTGGYNLKLMLNAGWEEEEWKGIPNDTWETGQHVDDAFTPLVGRGERGAVLGELTGETDVDWFAVNLPEDGPHTITLTSLQGESVHLSLYDWGGAHLIDADTDVSNVDAVVRAYTPEAAGLHHIRVSGRGRYTLLITRQAAFSLQPNDALETAQPLAGAHVALGHLAQDPREGLVLYLPFDADHGDVAPDYSGYGHDAIISGATFSSDGIRGGAYHFNGVSDHMIVSASPALNVASQMTMSAWFFTESDSAMQPIMEWHNTNTAKIGVHMWYNTTAMQWGSRQTGANLVDTTGNEHRVIRIPNPSPHEWHHLVIAYSSSDGRAELYLNGVRTATRNLAATSLQTSYELFVGTRPKQTFKWHGLLDELRVYNRVITSNEVWALYDHSGLGGDFYTYAADEGADLLIQTHTPNGTPHGPGNMLIPRLEIYDPSGALVAQDARGAEDGRNALVRYTNAVEGLYTIFVASEEGHGEYILGINIRPLILTMPTDVTEGDGELPDAGRVSIEDAIETDLLVLLDSDNIGEIVVPAFVLIPTGQTSTTFNITVIADGILDGTQVATVTATAVGYAAGQASIRVHDNESAELRLHAPSTVTEGDGVLTDAGTLSVDAPVGRDVRVSLESSDVSELIVPAYVTIPAGQTSSVFSITVVDDDEIDGTQGVTLTASVSNWISGSVVVAVEDNEDMIIRLQTPEWVTEGEGVIPDAGSVSISGTWPVDLEIFLFSDDLSELQVPPSVLLPAGDISVSFDITVVDDDEEDGTQWVHISASTAGFVSATNNIGVRDNDVHSFEWGPIPSPQTLDQPFEVRVEARTVDGYLATAFTGAVQLAAMAGAEQVSITPDESDPFSSAVWEGIIRVHEPAEGVVVTADDGENHLGDSYPFDVVIPITDFTKLPISLVGVSSGSVAWGDYNNNDYLDLLVAGRSGALPATRLYRNKMAPVEVPTNGLVLYYSFDEDHGSVVMDASGFGHTGIVHGATFVTNGIRGGAYHFNGVSDYILVPASSSLNVATQITMSAWFHTESSTAMQPILEWYNTNTLSAGVHMWFNTTAMQWGAKRTGANLVDATGNENRVISIPNPSSHEWHHLAITYRSDTGNSELYLNGASLATRGLSTTSLQTAFDLFIGSRPLQTFKWHGLLDEIRVYHRVLSSNEMYQVYLHGLSGPGFTEVETDLPGIANGMAIWGDDNNSGWLDILLSGSGATSALTRIYRNVAGEFFDSGIVLPGLSNSAVAWGDYNNDGYLDILLAGQAGTSRTTRVFRNMAGHNYVEADTSLPGVSHGTVAWVDYDNDGHLDLFLTGHGDAGPITELWRNTGHGVFVNSGVSFIGLSNSAAAWSDYNGDGFVDLLLAGEQNGVPHTKLYRNKGDGTFIEVAVPLPGITRASVSWGDVNNNGRPDILLSGHDGAQGTIRLYRNDGDNVFTDMGVFPSGLEDSAAAFGDFNNDGTLDFVIAGQGITPETSLYRNESTDANELPSPPFGLVAVVVTNRVEFSWDAGADQETVSTSLTYNVRIGTEPGLGDLWSPMALPDGRRTVVQHGNAGHRTSWWLEDLPPGAHWFSVQSIDSAYAGSFFPDPVSFDVWDRILLNLPEEATEGDGVLTNAGLVSIRFPAPDPVSIALLSTDVMEVEVPAAVVIPAGETSVLFNVTIIDDDIRDGAQQVDIVASAPGFHAAVHAITVRDNDLYTLNWSPIPSPQRRGQSFPVQIVAAAIDGLPIQNFNEAPILSAFGLGGAVQLTPPIAHPFESGIWSGSVAVLNNRLSVSLTAEQGDVIGDSMSFDVVGPHLLVDPVEMMGSVVVAGQSTGTPVNLSNIGNEALEFTVWILESGGWIHLEPNAGLILPMDAMDLNVVLDAGTTPAGSYLEGTIRLESNDGVVPVWDIPVSMTVLPPAPVLTELPPYIIGATNTISWSLVSGATRYWVERFRNTNAAPEAGSGWVAEPPYAFSGLSDGVLYYYRAIASATGCVGAVVGPWSDWVFTRQLYPESDWDGDGMPNEWEHKHGLNPLDPSDAGMDLDGDGMDNLSEYLAGTDPNNADSNLRVLFVQENGEDIVVQWRGGTNVRQYVEASASLCAENWAPVFTNYPPTTITNVIGVEGVDDIRFLRIRASRAGE